MIEDENLFAIVRASDRARSLDDNSVGVQRQRAREAVAELAAELRRLAVGGALVSLVPGQTPTAEATANLRAQMQGAVDGAIARLMASDTLDGYVRATNLARKLVSMARGTTPIYDVIDNAQQSAQDVASDLRDVGKGVGAATPWIAMAVVVVVVVLALRK